MVDSNVPSRRDGDAKLDEILDRIDSLAESHNRHLEELHPKISAAEAQRLIDQTPEIVESLDTVIDLLAGEVIYDPFTHQPTGERKPGIAARVESLEHRANGGGGLSVRLKTSDAVKVSIITAITTILGIVLTALLGGAV